MSDPVETNPDDEVDLSRMSEDEAAAVIEQLIDARPPRGVNLAVAQELIDGASPGPWRPERHDNELFHVVRPGRPSVSILGHWDQEIFCFRGDAEFIAAARQFLPAIVNELRDTRAKVQRHADHLDEIMALHHQEERSCDKWCEDICQVADDLREL